MIKINQKKIKKPQKNSPKILQIMMLMNNQKMFSHKTLLMLKSLFPFKKLLTLSKPKMLVKLNKTQKLLLPQLKNKPELLKPQLKLLKNKKKNQEKLKNLLKKVMLKPQQNKLELFNNPLKTNLLSESVKNSKMFMMMLKKLPKKDHLKRLFKKLANQLNTISLPPKLISSPLLINQLMKFTSKTGKFVLILFLTLIITLEMMLDNKLPY